MTVELRPLGVKCNIQCQYCYQNPQRDAGNAPRHYDLDKMKAAIKAEGGPFTLFGGEALMIPEKDLEELWRWGLENFGGNGVQTNGTLITDNLIRMFKQYRVQVGISVDGPGELNDVRWAGSLERTRELTARTHAAIERLCGEGIPPSLIITLHRFNATREKLPVMHHWLRHLQRLGVTSARLHLLEVDDSEIRAKYALSPAENLEALLSFAGLEKGLPTLKLDVFEDMRRLLRGDDARATCTWTACDPYTTRAVRGVEGNGQRSNCGRTNKDGIDFRKAGAEGFERYLALYHTPQECGGCNGCRFFLLCKGQCPGTAIAGDWRNRSENCATWMSLFEYVEKEMLAQGEIPLTQSPLRGVLERRLLQAWADGKNPRIATTLRQMDGTQVSWDPGPAGLTIREVNRSSVSRAADAGVRSRDARSARPDLERLPFELPEFTRLMWVSDRAYAVWGPRLRRIGQAWPEIEWRAVADGVRRCAIAFISPEELLYSRVRWGTLGLRAVVLQTQGVGGPSYRGKATPARPGQPLLYRLAVGRPRDLTEFKVAFERGSEAEMAALLGYPPCCAAFYRRVWVDERHVDTTWPMAIASAAPGTEATVLRVSGPAEANLLWRWMGVRAVPHLPCSFNCSHTAALGRRVLEVGRRVGFTEEVGWIQEILNWPVEWSALHGIAEIRTPILKVSTNTDATAQKYVVRRVGTTYPAEGVRGLRFPYQAPDHLLLSQSRGFKEGLRNRAASAAADCRTALPIISPCSPPERDSP